MSTDNPDPAKGFGATLPADSSLPNPSVASPIPKDRQFWNWISTQNPFYLLSAACVLHSTGWSFPGGNSIPAWSTCFLIVGYIILLAGCAFLVVRRWKLWDDARSILVVLFLLFLELALSLDQFAVSQPADGALAMFAGWIFAAGLCEILLLGLRLPLPVWYRLSLHTQLASQFLYPVLLIPAVRQAQHETVTGLITFFSVVIALPLLLLVPAAHQSPSSQMSRAAPWPWPWYPWTIPVVMTGCLLARSFSLCLSFDAVPDLGPVAAYEHWESIFELYFFVPTLLAVGILLLEFGRTTGAKWMQRAGLLMPVLAVMIGLQSEPMNPAAVRFQNQLVHTVGSPLWMTVVVSAVYYLIAVICRTPWAWQGLLFSLTALTAMSPETNSFRQFATPFPLLLGIVAGAILLLSVRRHSTLLALEAGGWMFAAMVFAPWLNQMPWPREMSLAHAAAVMVLLAALLFDDEAGQFLRGVLQAAMAISFFVLVHRLLRHHSPSLIPPVYGALIAVISIVFWWRWRDTAWRQLAIVGGAFCYVTGFFEGAFYLRRRFAWQGLPSFAVGLGLLHLGILVSALKARWRSSADKISTTQTS